MDKTRVLVIRYANKLSQSEIPLFRGAVIGAMEGNADILYHNHLGDSVLYHYPMIQYKRIGQCAAIVAVDSGADIIGQFLSSGATRLRIGIREENFVISDIKANNCLVQVWDGQFEYHLRKWLPFNSKNFVEYKCLTSLLEKIEFLEHILVGNILSFAKGVGINLDSNVVGKIVSVDDHKLMAYKGVKMMSYDLRIRSNVTIPDFVGIGKGVSLGFGTISRCYQEKLQTKDE